VAPGCLLAARAPLASEVGAPEAPGHPARLALALAMREVCAAAICLERGEKQHSPVSGFFFCCCPRGVCPTWRHLSSGNVSVRGRPLCSDLGQDREMGPTPHTGAREGVITGRMMKGEEGIRTRGRGGEEGGASYPVGKTLCRNGGLNTDLLFTRQMLYH